MKSLNIKKSFHNKNFKYGGISATVSIIVIAVLIGINILAVKFNHTYDLTTNKLFSLSDQSYKILSSLNKNVTFYVLDPSSKEDGSVKIILEKYTEKSKKITIEYKDPAKYPEFSKKYTTDNSSLDAGSIIVVCGSKYKVVNESDMVNVSYDESGQEKADSLAIEQLLTGAIVNVTSGTNQTIMILQGHEEGTLPSEITKQFGLENYDTKDIDLLTKDAKLSTDDALLVYSPKKDLSADEAAKIEEFLSKGGRAIFLMDIADNNMPNFLSVLKVYGIGIKKAVIVEGNASFCSQNPIYLLPQYGEHDIVYPISAKSLKTLIPAAQALDLLKTKKSTTVITPLLTTSSNSWGKINLQAQTLDKEKGDLTGPFTLAAAITDTPTDTKAKQTKLVVVSNGYFIDSQVINTGGNLDFFMNSVNWLQDQKESISIRPKSLDTYTISISTVQRLLLSGLVVIVIPLTVIIIGIVKVLKRKRL